MNTKGITMDNTTFQKPGFWFIPLAIVYPIAVILIESITGMSAESFIDPIPTVAHLLMLITVPLSSLVYFLAAFGKVSISHKKMAFLTGIALGTSLLYTFYYAFLMPIGLIAIVLLGIGLLPFAPLVSLIMHIRIYFWLSNTQSLRKPMLLGFGLSWLAFSAFDLPFVATSYALQQVTGEQTEAEISGIKLLRLISNEKSLSELVNRNANPEVRPLRFLWKTMVFDMGNITLTDFKVIYFRVTGLNLDNTATTEMWERGTGMNGPVGGRSIGKVINELSLINSQMDGKIVEADGVAYIEWVLEIENSGYRNREARLQLTIPQGAVVSRATLWVNGEEQEAAYTTTGKATQVYESIVQANRDPLLVTTHGPDRVLARLFPVLPRGNAMKFKIGMTVPVEVVDKEQSRILLPVISQSNFITPPNTEHYIWIESGSELYNQLGKSEQLDSNRFRWRAVIKENATPQHHQSIKFDTAHVNQSSWSELKDSGPIIQSLLWREEHNDAPLAIVLDTSKSVEFYKESVLEALTQIKPQRSVHVYLPGDAQVTKLSGRWTEDFHQQVTDVINQHTFAGGQDNVKALIDAIYDFESLPNATVLWIHGIQPVHFASYSQLEQISKRLKLKPHLYSISLQRGANILVESKALKMSVNNIPFTGDLALDLRRLLKHDVFSNWKREVASEQDILSSSIKGSNHIVRLWAKGKVQEMLPKQKQQASELASHFQLVTSVSAALVLETQKQYDDNDLEQADKKSVAKIPLPSSISLFLLGLFIMVFVRRSN